MEKERDQDAICFMGTFPPRECGIATFTKDLSDAIEKKFFPYLRAKIIAMNNNGVNVYNYPSKVIYQISDTERDQYKKIADKVNKNRDIKIISIQHEFGIFGGEYGQYLLNFLDVVRKPVIITFHSILPDPDKKRKKIVRAISEKVWEIVVMTPKGEEILRKDYGITTPIRVIPHGIPVVSFESQNGTKKQLGYEGKILLVSFGMVNRGKGYENVIEGLPEVVKKYPNLVYLIVGATHPVVRKNEGEDYRNFLDKKIKELGLTENVKFYNKYVALKEIIQYLKASDIYISSTLTPEQITSGTLAYAMGCGRATISTPFLHAQDMVNHERGVLLESFQKPEEYSQAILRLLGDKNLRKDAEQNSYEYTRPMTWPNVALSYGDLIRDYIAIPDIYFERLPRINTEHIKRMTDDFGILQFAKYSTPHGSSGYTLDDNSRALIVASKLYSKYRNPMFLNLSKIYFNYIKHVQLEDGRFCNVVDKDKTLNKDSWSEEAYGRAVKSLGFVTSLQSIPKDMRDEAEDILLKALPIASDLNSPRALSSIIAGLYYYNKENYSRDIVKTIRKFADRIVDMYEENSSYDWRWFEPALTYSNSKICEALFYAYIATQNLRYLNIAEKSLNFLIGKTFENGVFVPIGQNGWYKKGGERSYFDQQPIDVSSMVQTLALAYKLTKNVEYGKNSIKAFHWFLGKNTLNQVVYNEKSGGCYDGLDKENLNLNQGAESTVSYMLARLSLDEI